MLPDRPLHEHCIGTSWRLPATCAACPCNTQTLQYTDPAHLGCNRKQGQACMGVGAAPCWQRMARPPQQTTPHTHTPSPRTPPPWPAGTTPQRRPPHTPWRALLSPCQPALGDTPTQQRPTLQTSRVSEYRQSNKLWTICARTAAGHSPSWWRHHRSECLQVRRGFLGLGRHLLASIQARHLGLHDFCARILDALRELLRILLADVHRRLGLHSGAHGTYSNAHRLQQCWTVSKASAALQQCCCKVAH
jgi:hypothetical protein